MMIIKNMMTIIILVNMGILIIKYKTTSIRIEALRTQGHVQICHVAPTAIASSTSSLQILSFPSQTHLNVRHHLAEQMTLLFLLILSNIGLFLSRGGGDMVYTHKIALWILCRVTRLWRSPACKIENQCCPRKFVSLKKETQNMR